MRKCFLNIQKSFQIQLLAFWLSQRSACSVFSPLLSRHAQNRPYSSFQPKNFRAFEANVKADEKERGLLQGKIGVLALALYKKLGK